MFDAAGARRTTASECRGALHERDVLERRQEYVEGFAMADRECMVVCVCVTCVCEYIVTSGVTVWVTTMSEVWSASE